MSYQVNETNVDEITTKKVTPSRKIGQRTRVVFYSRSGTITLYLTDEQLQEIQGN